MNTVTLSGDRRHMTVVSPDGRRTAELRSELADGFTDEHVEYAKTSFTWITDPGVHTTRRKLIFGHPVYLHINTGPPTWWWPRVMMGKGHVGAGWLRACVAVGW